MTSTFTWSDQQQAIFDEIITPTAPTLCIQAVAGAAKSSTLVEAISRYTQIYTDATVRYLIFGSMAAKDARSEFGTDAIVSTLHSFAYQFTVKQFKLGTVKQFLTWRDLPKSIKRPFGADFEILQMLEDYCLSDYISIADYAMAHTEDSSFRPSYVRVVKQLLNHMASGNMPITHSFYLKLFHVLVMNKTIQLPHVNRLLVDEFQDMSGMALDIIKSIPADQKVFVGDPNQSIFEFLNLSDGFAHFPDAKTLTLSKSFRVDQSYAPAIQHYLRNYLDPEAVFEGMEYSDKPVIKSTAYLVRNNNTLIAKMIEYNEANIPYRLSTAAKINQIFKLPKALIYAKPGFDQKDSELEHLQYDIDDWGSLSQAKRENLSLFKYLQEVNPDDPKLKSAITLIGQYGSDAILEAEKQAKQHQSQACDLHLMTCHTSKGATFDRVILDDDINKSIIEAIEAEPSPARHSELCLGFVSVTRHRFELLGCRFLGVI